MDDYDLIVIGGCIGGSACAATMAGEGVKVLVLEKHGTFEDQVRGEWIAPWGVAEIKRLGLHEVLMAAGGHHIARHVTYDESIPPSVASAAALPLDTFVEGVPGPLSLGHPQHCRALFDEAARRGATMLSGADVTAVFTGEAPRVTYTIDGEAREARARLLVGADGRNSIVRDACGITLSADPPHHMFGGLLVDGVEGWDDAEQAQGAEDGFSFVAFPQGGGRLRVFGSFGLTERYRYAGPGGPRRFLDSFRMSSSPQAALIAEGEPAGPLLAYINSDTWTDELYTEGAVLVGDAAGWTDPLIAVGLSSTYRDVRIVTDLLKGSETWSGDLFAPYATERRERMRRLRFIGRLTASLHATFGDAARDRRRRYLARVATEPALNARTLAILAGPEAAPPETFTPEYRELVLGEDLMLAE